MLLKKLVVAEDEDAIFHLLQATVGDAGYLCLRARNGEEALHLARTELPDAIIMDRGMPVLDGLEVVKRLKADVLLSGIPVLMLTARSTVEDRVEGLEAGADDYLPKPFDVRELAARVKALVRQSRREKHRSPITGLPSGEAIDEHVAMLLRKKKPLGLCYVDLDGWEAYADACGFRRYEDLIERLGKALLEAVQTVAQPTLFLGHVGGDDFIVVCEPGQLEPFRRAALERFEALLGSIDVPAGAALPRLGMFVVRTDETPVKDLDELSAMLADAKRGGRKKG